MESASISQLVRSDHYALLDLRNVHDEPGVAAKVFRAIARAEVNVEEIVQNVSTFGKTDISFLTARHDASAALKAVQGIFDGPEIAISVAMDTVIFVLYGVQFKTEPSILARFTGAFATSDANIDVLTTSAIRLLAATNSGSARGLESSLASEFDLSCAHYAELPR